MRNESNQITRLGHAGNGLKFEQVEGMSKRLGLGNPIKLPDLQFDENAYIKWLGANYPGLDKWLIPGYVAAQKTREAAGLMAKNESEMSGVSIYATDIVRFNGTMLTKPAHEAEAWKMFQEQSGQMVVDVRGSALLYDGHIVTDNIAYISYNHMISRKDALDWAGDPNSLRCAGGLSVMGNSREIMTSQPTVVLRFNGNNWVEIGQISAGQRLDTKIFCNELFGGGPISGTWLDKKLEAYRL